MVPRKVETLTPNGLIPVVFNGCPAWRVEKGAAVLGYIYANRYLYGGFAKGWRWISPGGQAYGEESHRDKAIKALEEIAANRRISS